ncbi:MAG TPA: hypothetical protein VKB26_06525 [Candidatus Acidoferrales bacterium]|nr:hypothetical protein [Candidatus Acidoferrales bacterium]
MYFKWSLEWSFVWPPGLVATLVLLGNLGASLALKWPFRAERWKKSYWLVFANFLFIPVMLAIGVIWALDPSSVQRGKPNFFAAWTPDGLLIVSLILGIYWIYRMKGLRWFGASITLVALWMLYWAGCITTMALSGYWL